MTPVPLGLTFGDLMEVLLACRQLNPGQKDPVDFQCALTVRLAETSRELASEVMRFDRVKMIALAEFAATAHALASGPAKTARRGGGSRSGSKGGSSKNRAAPVPAPQPTEGKAERRRCRRRPAKGRIRVFCHKGSLDLGPNLAAAVLDVSESGVRLLVKTPLEKGQEVLVGLEGQGHLKPLRRPGTVAWCHAADTGGFQVGVQLQTQINYQDVFKLS